MLTRQPMSTTNLYTLEQRRQPPGMASQSLEQISSGDGVKDDTESIRRQKPWWKRPSPWWLLVGMPFTSISSFSKLAPRFEIYTTLACAEHRPDILGPSSHVGQGLDAIVFRNAAPDANTSGTPVAQIHVPGKFPLNNETINADHSPPNWKVCAADPIVQASVAKLIAVISNCSGILGLLTTGWWGGFSDRHGRIPVLLICSLGLFLSDISFVLVANFHARLPGGYRFLILGSVLDGILGGFTTAVAVHHTYLTDTTDAHSRSRILSLNIGLYFIGMTIGPMFGSLLIRATGLTLSVFYSALFVESLHILSLYFLIPESVTMEQMAFSVEKYHAHLLGTGATEPQGNAGLRRLKRVFAFLSPLTLFMPSIRTSKDVVSKPRRDWTLTKLAVSFGLMISVMGALQFKFQYAASAFGWSSEQIGYWLSLLGASRAIFMTAILPVAIKILKPKPVERVTAGRSTNGETSPLLGTSNKNRSGPSATTMELSSFDLNLARCSLLVELISYFLMAIAQNAYQFTVFAIVGSFGLGFHPAMQSTTLMLYTLRGGTESGRLFGALSVVQALSSQIFGPALYGFVYARTVSTFPRAIFCVTVVTLIISLTILLSVRLSKEDHRTTDPEE